VLELFSLLLLDEEKDAALAEDDPPLVDPMPALDQLIADTPNLPGGRNYPKRARSPSP